jgi:outer membrane scaffolding protein for murein synthesis (MipA/OmpV family)
LRAPLHTVLTALLVVGAGAASGADSTRPLWELGVGAGVVTFGNYPGSATTQAYPVPVPYLRYRGKFLRADRDGVRGVLFEQPRVAINLSAGASVPVRSSGDAARAGMPDLRATLEAGPALDLHLWRSHDRAIALDARLPVRLAFTVSAPPRTVGWFIAPNLNLDFHHLGGRPGWNLGLLAGPLYATRHYNDYYYSVAPAYATPGRAAYAAPGGYAGTEVIAALSRRYPKLWVGAFVRYEALGGAVFAASPLLRRDHDWAGGVGVAWIVSHSARQVSADE